MAVVYVGVAAFRTEQSKLSRVVVHDLEGARKDADRVVSIRQSVVQVGVRAQDDIDIDVLVLVANGATMLDRCHHINFVDRRASEPQRVESLNALEDAGHSDRPLQYLHELSRSMLVLE